MKNFNTLIIFSIFITSTSGLLFSTPKAVSSIRSIAVVQENGPFKTSRQAGIWKAANFNPATIPTLTDSLIVQHDLILDNTVGPNLSVSSTTNNKVTINGHYFFYSKVTDSPNSNRSHNLSIAQHGAVTVGQNGILALKGKLTVSGNGLFEVAQGGTGSFGGALELNSNGRLIVRAGQILTIGTGVNPGNSSIASTSAFFIEKGGKLIINGLLKNSGSGVVDGELIINGSYSGLGTSKITGTGKVTTQGTISFTSTPNSSSIFQSIVPCEVGPCERNNICKSTLLNTITGDSISCKAIDPDEFKGNSVTGATYYWQSRSLSNTNQEFSNAQVASRLPDYKATTVSLSTLYRRELTTDNKCFSISDTISIIIGSTTKQTFTNIVSNNWSDAGNWCFSKIPTKTVDVIIPGNNIININGTAECKSLNILPNSILNFDGTSLLITGNLINNGTFNNVKGKVQFAGSSNQTITGSNSFKDLRINSGAEVTVKIGYNQVINGVLTLQSGIFNTSSSVTIDFEKGGAISGLGNGNVKGLVTGKRSLTGPGWHLIGAPFVNVTYRELSDDITFGPKMFYTYQEQLNTPNSNVGWIARNTSDLSVRLDATQKDPGGPSKMIGYGLKLTANALIDITGTYDHSIKSFETGSLSYTPTGKPEADGWQIISNPFPSYIDWSSENGWEKTNVASTIYYYNSSTKSNAVYNNHPAINEPASNNGGSPYIPPMQAFWIKTTKSPASVRVKDEARVSVPDFTTFPGAPSFYRQAATSEIKTLKLKVKSFDSNSYDETIVRFFSSSTEDFDDDFDAYKQKNDATVPSLYTHSNTLDFAINTIPSLTTNKVIDLYLEAPKGSYQLSVQEIRNFNGSVYLKDKTSGIAKLLLPNSVINFVVDSITAASRFELLFSKEELVTSTNNNNAESTIFVTTLPGSAEIKFIGNHTSTADIVLYNTLGHEIFRRDNANITSGSFSINRDLIPAGVYIIKTFSNNNSYTSKINFDK